MSEAKDRTVESLSRACDCLSAMLRKNDLEKVAKLEERIIALEKLKKERNEFAETNSELISKNANLKTELEKVQNALLGWESKYKGLLTANAKLVRKVEELRVKLNK